MKRFLRSFIRTILIISGLIYINFGIFYSLVSVDREEFILAFKLTSVNILLISMVFAVGESFLYYHAVKKPLQRITEGIRRFMEGRFGEKIEPFRKKDHTEFDQIITGLNKMADELTYMESIRTDFISNVSHEMKTPLAVIQNYSILLQAPDLTDDKRQEYTKGIVHQTKKMSHMFSNILKLSKLENQNFVPNLEIYNLGEQICECMLLYEEVWESKNMEIETHIEENVMVNLDRELLSQVWVNLISNAVKFTKEGDRIILGLRTEEEKVIFTISDTGCGMEETVVKNIFHKFYQGDTSHATPGNGLGLPLVKSIVNAFGGTIEVKSTPQIGSTFTITLNK